MITHLLFRKIVYPERLIEIALADAIHDLHLKCIVLSL